MSNPSQGTRRPPPPPVPIIEEEEPATARSGPAQVERIALRVVLYLVAVSCLLAVVTGQPRDEQTICRVLGVLALVGLAASARR